MGSAKSKAIISLVLTFFFWGSVYVAGKMIAQDVPPMLLACLRCVVAVFPHIFSLIVYLFP